MLKRVALLGGLTLVLGLAVVPTAHASPRLSLSVQIGPQAVMPYRVAQRGPAGYIWQAGYYVRTPYGRRWVEGAWVPGPYFRGNSRSYGSGDWRERRGDDRDGYWRRDRDGDRDRDHRYNDRRDDDRRRYDRDDRGYRR